MTERPGGQPGADDSGADNSRAEDARAEEVLEQALRVMAGGGKTPGRSPGHSGERIRRRLSTGQLVLLAAIIGLLIGIGAGFASLML